MYIHEIPENKIKAREVFLSSCSAETVEIHAPIINLYQTEGFLNPAGLGHADNFSNGNGWGQSTVAFDSHDDFFSADKTGRSIYGGAEYGVVQTVESVRVCEKFSEIHGGTGAIILSSGLSAINTVFSTFLKGEKPTIFIPDNCYYPALRALNFMSARNPNLKYYVYPSRAGRMEILNLLDEAKKAGRTIDMVYLETPGSQTFEIAEIQEIIEISRAHDIKTVMDNTWASHVRFKPLDWGIDIVIQATTKYESGFADTPSGVIIAAKKDDYAALENTMRILGTGAVDKATCRRLFSRVASAGTRLDKHFESALKVAHWFQSQSFVLDVLCPFLPTSPDFERFKKYFDHGNGLLSVSFQNSVTPEKVEQFLDNMLLFRQGESWGGHVSLAQPAHPKRFLSQAPEGELVRFSVGLEDAEDLVRDIQNASLYI